MYHESRHQKFIHIHEIPCLIWKVKQYKLRTVGAARNCKIQVVCNFNIWTSTSNNPHFLPFRGQLDNYIWHDGIEDQGLPPILGGTLGICPPYWNGVTVDTPFVQHHFPPTTHSQPSHNQHLQNHPSESIPLGTSRWDYRSTLLH